MSIAHARPGGWYAALLRGIDRVLACPAVYLVASLLLIQPDIVETYGNSIGDYTLFNALQAVCRALLCLVSLIYALRWMGGRVRRFSPVLLCVFALHLYLYILTRARGGFFNYSNNMHAFLCMLLLVDMGVQREKKSLLCGLSLALELCVYANALALLLWPGGIFHALGNANARYWVLGNNVIYYRVLFPAMGVAAIYAYERKGRLDARAWALLYTGLFTVCVQRGGAGIVGFCVLVALTLLFIRRSIPRWLRLELVAALSVLAFFAFTYLNVQRLFAFFIEGVLHKSLTFSNRVPAWERALAYAMQRPLLGNGVNNVNAMMDTIGVAHAHNHLLELFMQGGVVALALFLPSLCFAGRALARHRTEPAVKATAILLFAFVVLCIVEKMISCTLFYPLILLASRAEFLRSAAPELADNGLFGRWQKESA